MEVHSVGDVVGCLCNILSTDRGDLSSTAGFADRSTGGSWEMGVALRTKPAPPTLRIMGASSDPSTLRRSRPK